MANQQNDQQNLGNQGQKNPIQNPNQGEQKDFANKPGQQNVGGEQQNQSGQTQRGNQDQSGQRRQ